MKKYCLLTNDVETTSIWHNSFRDETGLKVLNQGMPLLLDLYEKYSIKSTFFFTGYIAKLYPEVVKMIIKNGHEVASHGMSHLKKNGFDIMPLDKQIKHLSESKKLLEDISGSEVISFRAPALRVNSDTAKALDICGYKIDSSVASQRFDMFMSFGGVKKLNWLFTPRLPYRTSSDSLFEKGNGKIIEVPISASILPYVGTTIRMFPKISSYQRKILAFESSVTGKPIVSLVHPNEFIDESHENRIIEKRSKNILTSLFQDTLRSKLKIKNLGISGLELYENQIIYFNKNDFNFITLRDYVNLVKTS